jgi:hypothetical protein
MECNYEDLKQILLQLVFTSLQNMIEVNLLHKALHFNFAIQLSMSMII